MLAVTLLGIDFSGLSLGHALALAGGMLLLMALQWASKWIDSKGVEFVKGELEKLRTKANENSLLGQIAADDAVINILEASLPEVLHEAGDEVQQAVATGNLKNFPWQTLAQNLWAKAKPQVEGGVHNYIAQSSFRDATVIAQQVIKRFLAKKALAQTGIIADPPRTEAATTAEPVK